MLLADPRRAELGGQLADVTVLFADLGSYSTYAEKRAPSEVVAMLNEYFGVALPAIIEYGGVPVQLAGDAVMAVFGAPKPQADHAARACRAALAILDGPSPSRPVRAAVRNSTSGSIRVRALVGNIGSEAYRNFTAIGDTTNLAARLQGLAKPGEVVIGPHDGGRARQLVRAVIARAGDGQGPGAEPTEVYALRST